MAAMMAELTADWRVASTVVTKVDAMVVTKVEKKVVTMVSMMAAE